MQIINIETLFESSFEEIQMLVKNSEYSILVDFLEELKIDIQYHNFKYYVEDNPQIEDSEYDLRYNTLLFIESIYPELKTEDSPSQIVGGEVTSKFEKVIHEYPLFSLEKANNVEELREWLQNMNKKFEEEGLPTEYILELKIDGLTTCLKYREGLLKLGATRGNGSLGEDVTENALEVLNIPKKIPYKGDLDLAGEVYMPTESFRQLREDGIVLANCRNGASGTMRQLDSSIVAKRGLKYFAFNLLDVGDDVYFENHEESLKFLTEQGFEISPNCTIYTDIEELINACIYYSDKRHDLGFDIDGMVIKVNNKAFAESLGNTMKYPRSAVAFKFPPEQSIGIVISIDEQVGRTGVITPVANILDENGSPLRLAGTDVSRATLHNYDEIEKKDIRIGCKVVVQKGGDIIPDVVKVVTEEGFESLKPITPPTNCPACESILEKYEDEVAIRCTNPNCPAQVKLRIYHFASREAMNIEGLGEETVSKLLKINAISNLTDLYFLDTKTVINMDKFAEKSTENLLNSIEKSKSTGLEGLIIGLGIRFVGVKTAKILGMKFRTMDNLMNSSYEELINIDGIGIKTAKSVNTFFNRIEIIEMISILKKAMLDMNSKQEELLSEDFKDITFVITGTFSSSNKKKEMKELVVKNGGKVTSNISKKTGYIVKGTDSGPAKEKKINELLLIGDLKESQIIDEETFDKLFNK